MTDEKFKKIVSDLEAASDGASMRIAIVNALTALNNDGGNALTFGGFYSDYYLYRDDFEKGCTNLSLLLDALDDNPEQDSVSLIASGNMKYYLDSIITRFRTINGGSEGEKRNTVVGQLHVLKELKGQIKDAINSMISDPNKRIDDEIDSFIDYATKLKEGVEVAYKFEEYTATYNGTHIPDPGELWNIVNVNVKPRVGLKRITTYGKYSVEKDPNLDAWNPVIIEVPGAPRKNAGSSYNPSSSGSHKKEAEQLNLEDKSVTKNNIYSPGQGYDAIGSIDVNVTEIDPEILKYQVFNVEWQNYDGTSLDAKDQVTGGTAAIYEGPIPEKETDDGCIWTFSHFDPPTDYVDHDIVTTAVFTEARYAEEDSQRSWEEILSGVSRNDIGMNKVLNLLPCKGHSNTVRFGPIMMRLVDVSPQGQVWLSENLLSWQVIYRADTGSEWVSPTPVNGWFVGKTTGVGHRGTTSDQNLAATRLGWANAPLRTWLETRFIECLPPMIRESLVEVNKSYYNITTTDMNNTDVADAWSTAMKGGLVYEINEATGGMGCEDGTNYIKSKIWIPSVHEISQAYFKDGKSDAVMRQASQTRSLAVEKEGDIYSNIGNYPDVDQTDWSEDRLKAISDIYTNAGEYFTLKHNFYYPHRELIATYAPYYVPRVYSNSDSYNYGYQERVWGYACWPTRTTFGQATLMHVNQFGNSKADVRNAANEDIKDANCNLLKTPFNLFNNYLVPYGICFGMVLK